MPYRDDELELFRRKRENPNGNRAHFMCTCGCPISANKETCLNCGADTASAEGFGVAILPYLREERAKRMRVR